MNVVETLWKFRNFSEDLGLILTQHSEAAKPQQIQHRRFAEPFTETSRC